jgi:diguanylate cyclase (GGDEF)-like protein
MVEHIIQNYDKTKNKQALIAEANAIHKLMLPNLVKIGHNNVERWEATAATLASINAIDADYSLDGFVYQSDNPRFSKNFILLVGAGFLLLGLGLITLWLYTRRLRTEVQRHIRGRNRLQIAQKAAIKKAYTDELSGMANRRSCYEYGTIAIEDAKKNKDPISIIMIDIDHFKRINDEYGHAIGDEFICAMAKVIIGRIRETDIHGRIGGEEFAIILPDTDLGMAGELAEDIRKILEATEVMVEGKALKMTASFGVAKLESASDDINFIMKRADEALYRAKKSGRNKVVVY